MRVGFVGTPQLHGLAFDPNGSVLYASSTETDQLLTIDPATAEGTVVGDLGFDWVAGLAFDSNANVLLGVDFLDGIRLVIDTTTGAASVVGSFGAATSVDALTFDPATNTLYGTDVWKDQLIGIDRSTGVSSVVTGLGFTRVNGFEYKSSENLFYATDTLKDVLLTVSPYTGLGTSVGSLGFDEVRAIALDPGTNTLYGADIVTDQLITIDQTTGAATAIGPLGFDRVLGLAFDSDSGILYGADGTTNQLLIIDTATGAGSAVGGEFIWWTVVTGLAFDPSTGVLYGDGAGYLFTVDPTTGVATEFATHAHYYVGDLAFDTNRHVLFAADDLLDTVVTIDPETGLGQSFNTLAYNNIMGMAYDSRSGLLYATAYDKDWLIILDPLTGSTRNLKWSHRFEQLRGLAHDPITNTLYGWDQATEQLIRLDATIGDGIAIASIPGLSFADLAFDPAGNTLYGVTTNTRDLMTINPLTGETEVVLSLGSDFYFPGGLAFDADANALYIMGYWNNTVAEVRLDTLELNIVDDGPYYSSGFALLPPNDCDGNAILDVCDIADGSSQDCNANGVPDPCDVAPSPGYPAGSCTLVCSEDCNENGIPDECEPDCNFNGISDDCEPDEDCNSNQRQDICDIGAGLSLDCNDNYVPDECEIAGQTSEDDDGNGVLDECESRPLLPAAPPHNIRKNRFLALDPNNTLPIVIRVEIAKLVCNQSGDDCSFDRDCWGCTGGDRDGRGCRSDADCGPDGTCLDDQACVTQKGFFDPISAEADAQWESIGWVGEPCRIPTDNQVPEDTFASLVVNNMPETRVFAEQTVFVSDCEIMPRFSYGLTASVNGHYFANRLVIGTIVEPRRNLKKWADVVGLRDADTGLYTEPNLRINADDVQAMINFINDKSYKPHFTVVDLAPEVVNYKVNADDLQLMLRAFNITEDYPPLKFQTESSGAEHPENCPYSFPTTMHDKCE